MAQLPEGLRCNFLGQCYVRTPFLVGVVVVILTLAVNATLFIIVDSLGYWPNKKQGQIWYSLRTEQLPLLILGILILGWWVFYG